MQMLSATDVAIAAALANNTLRTSEHSDRFGGTYIAISDEHGLIEVALSTTEAEARIASVGAGAA